MAGFKETKFNDRMDTAAKARAEMLAKAKARAEAITQVMTGTLKFEPARITGKPADAVEEADKNGVPAKLSFEPVK